MGFSGERMAAMWKLVGSEAGSATVESVLWVPAFVLLLLLSVEASIVYGDDAMVRREVQDVNREYSVHALTTTAQVEQEITSYLGKTMPDAKVTASVANGVLTTVVQMPVSELIGSGLQDLLPSVTLTVAAEEIVES